MKNHYLALLLVLAFAGCTGTHRKGISRYDDYDAVKVDQMVGNNVSGKVFEKTIVCLNARRESRRVTALTNATVVLVTNVTITPVTNLTISIATNFVASAMTNLTPQAPLTVLTGGDAVPPDPTAPSLVTNTAPALTTNITLSLA